MSVMRRGLRALFDNGQVSVGRTPLALASLAPAIGVLGGCEGGGMGGGVATGVGSSVREPAAPGGAAMSAPATRGDLIFHDVSLSASVRQACSSCHVAENGHAAANSLPAQMGAADLDLPGARAVPGLRSTCRVTGPSVSPPMARPPAGFLRVTTPTRPTSTSACATPRPVIWPGALTCAGLSKCRRCAMWRCAKPVFTTAASAR